MTICKELEDSFVLVSHLQNLKCEKEIICNKKISIEIEHYDTKSIHRFEIQLLENMRLVTQLSNNETKKVWSKSLCNVFDIENKKMYWEKKSLQEIFRNIKYGLKYPNDFDENIWFDLLY
jgi:hypothetical protein